MPLEHKIHIFSPPCNILYLFCPCQSVFIGKRKRNVFVFFRCQCFTLNGFVFDHVYSVLTDVASKVKCLSITKWNKISDPYVVHLIIDLFRREYH